MTTVRKIHLAALAQSGYVGWRAVLETLGLAMALLEAKDVSSMNDLFTMRLRRLRSIKEEVAFAQFHDVGASSTVPTVSMIPQWVAGLENGADILMIATIAVRYSTPLECFDFQ